MEQLPQKLTNTELPQKTHSDSLQISRFAKNDLQKSVYLATLGRLFADFDITDKKKPDAAQLISLITKWRMMLGLKDEPTGEETALNASFIKDEYPDFSIEMVELAIKLSLRGALRVDIKPYGAFSPIYIATILNAYKKYADGEINEILKEKYRADLKEKNEPKVLTKDEKYESRLFLLNYYKENCVFGYVPDFKEVVWNVLKHNSIVNNEMLERIDYKERAMKSAEKEKKSSDITKAIDVNIEELEKHTKYIVIHDYIKDVDFTKLNIFYE